MRDAAPPTRSKITISPMSDPRAAPIQRYLEQWATRVEERLDALLPRADHEPAVVLEAMRYSVLGGGKRLRPALVLLGARAAGADEASVLGAACAVEFMHTYSLIHDDLPAMDDDDFRRGRPSCHRKFGEAAAILAGDALNTHAFAVIASTAPDRSRVADLVLELCRAAGAEGMVGGQAADLAGEGAAPTLDVVRSIHERKTAALLCSSLRLGALAVGASADVLERLTGYGGRMGLAFQIVDDVLDEEGVTAELGKTAGKDRARGKLTYPAAVGVERSRAIATGLLAEADALVAGKPAGDLLASLSAFILTRRS
jgi:geranylgeranyl pyrophosphate synthase